MSPVDTAARNRRVGATIRRRRQALGWEQRELAERVGVHVNSVQKWESGTHYPGRKLGKLEAVLGITLDSEPGRPVISDKLRGQIEAEAGDLAPEMIAAVERILARERGEEGPSSGQGPVRRAG